MDDPLLRRLLSRLSLSAYERLITNLFNQRRDEPFQPLSEAGEHVFFQPILDSYGESLHRVFTVHHSPLELMGKFDPSHLADPALKERIARVWEIYKGRKGAWGMVSPLLKSDRTLQSFAFLTNLTGYSRREYENEIIPTYEQIAKRMRLRPGKLFVGSYDSFLDLSLNGTRNAFEHFVTQDGGELRISLTGEEPSIHRAAVERNFEAGVLRCRLPSEPVYLLERDEAILLEFQDLLRREASEAQIERFLSANYQLIFGPQYDRVELQLWLKFPSMDIGQRKRRLDVFLRNSISRDWELLELKRPSIRLARTVRDVPIFTHAITTALQQARNYGQLLKQDSVKRRLAQEGIEYYEPSLGLVVGKSPEISHEHWRWLLRASPDVRITTYDDLLTEAHVRASDRAAAANSSSRTSTIRAF